MGALFEGLFTMPQPFSRIVPDAHIALSPSALSDKPDMAILVTEIFAISAHIEHELNLLLVRILGAVEGPAIAIFSILTAQHLQIKALDAAAKAALVIEDYEVFLAILSAVESAQSPRNQLAHWIWATCKQRPDLLALADPKMIRDRDLRVQKYFQSGRQQTAADWQKIWDLYQFDPSNVLAFSKTDLERAKTDLSDMKDALFEFELYLHPEMPLASPLLKGISRDELRVAILNRLNDKRLFREALVRIRADQQNSHPKTPE